MSNPITGHTRIVGIIGHPVVYTLSPAMHNAEFERLELDYRYLAFPVESTKLATAVHGLASLGVVGFNVTIPHKQHVVHLLDEVSAEARSVGAVNTVRIQDGRLIGYNTDVSGWVEDIERFIALRGRRVAIAGAGGAARAVAVGAARSGVDGIVIVNRTQASAEILAEAMRQLYPHITVEVCPRDAGDSGKRLLASCNVLVNTTPLGMDAPDATLPLPIDWLHPALVVYDTVYTPARTALIRAAEAVGCTAVGGIGMLARQGALAFEIWTGRRPDVARMEATLRHQLGI